MKLLQLLFGFSYLLDIQFLSARPVSGLLQQFQTHPVQLNLFWVPRGFERDLHHLP